METMTELERLQAEFKARNEQRQREIEKWFDRIAMLGFSQGLMLMLFIWKHFG